MRTVITLDNYKKELNVDNLNEINFKYISRIKKLSEDFIAHFIRHYIYKLDSANISYYQILSEDFIKKYKNFVDWYYISAVQILSEKTILEMQDKVNWTKISSYQKLSEEFIEDNLDRLDFYKVIEIQELSDEFCAKHNVKSNILKSVFHCGTEHRSIYRTKDEPELIRIGCFKGTRDKAIKAISKKYKGKEKEDYISKVNECFNI